MLSDEKHMYIRNAGGSTGNQSVHVTVATVSWLPLQFNPSLSRYDSVLVNRLRIGHTRLTNSYLLKGENQPECQICHSPLTVKHILTYCICFSAARQRYFGVNTLKELFENVQSRNIVAFIKDINFYHCI